MSRLVALLVLAVPAPVWACSTCFDPKDQRQSNFLFPTIFMTLLPLTMFAVIGGWLWLSFRRANAPAPTIPFQAGASPRP